MRHSVILLSLVTTVLSAYQVCNLNFYSTPYFFGESRLEKNWLASIDLSCSVASTSHGHNAYGDRVCLLDVYGPHSIAVSHGMRNGLQSTLPPVRFSGKFTIKQYDFSCVQNFLGGFFIGCYIPHLSLSIKEISLKQCHESQGSAFVQEFNAALKSAGLSLDPYKKHEVGDSVVYAGWALNYEKTDVLDFVDFDFMLGGLVPTSCHKSVNIPFDIPGGHEGHAALIVRSDLALGVYDWLTVGVHGQWYRFFSSDRPVRLKTICAQRGMIKNICALSHVDRGDLLRIGTFFKADHLVRGWSFLLGYSYVRRNPDCVVPYDARLFSPAIIASDEQLQGFKMHVFHFTTDYDFTTDGAQFGHRIGIFYNHQIAGVHTFNANTGGGTLGLDIVWSF